MIHIYIKPHQRYYLTQHLSLTLGFLFFLSFSLSRLRWPTKLSTRPAVTPPLTSASTMNQRRRLLVLAGPRASPLRSPLSLLTRATHHLPHTTTFHRPLTGSLSPSSGPRRSLLGSLTTLAPAPALSMPSVLRLRMALLASIRMIPALAPFPLVLSSAFLLSI